MASDEKKTREMDAIAARIAAKISPTREELAEEKAFAEKLMASLDEKLPKEAEIIFVGSAARDTGLKGDMDIDLFITYPKDKTREYIVEKTIAATKKAIKANWVMHYAEHPYLKTVLRGFSVEVIPCFRIQPNEGTKSAVDRSPLHMDYLQKNLTPAQRRDVRVLKQFLKNAGIYGAELEVQGFSGLVCEYLVLNYRSFSNLILEARNWRLPVVIDMESAYQELTKKEIAQKFGNAPLVLVDAIDLNRNAAAATSETNVAKFIELCRVFSEKPSEEFFFRKKTAYSREMVLNKIRGRDTAIYLVETTKPDLVSDILFPQLRKTESCVVKQLQLNGFTVFDSVSFATEKKCFVLVETEECILPKIRRVHGPPVSAWKDVRAFIHKHKKCIRGPFIEGSRVFVEEERKIREAKEVIELIKKNPAKYGVASNFIPLLKKARVLEGKNIASTGDALQGLGEYFYRKEFYW